MRFFKWLDDPAGHGPFVKMIGVAVLVIALITVGAECCDDWGSAVCQ